MSQQVINIGTTSNDGTGDPLRTAWQKTNENFTELYVGKCPIAGPGSSQAFAVGALSATSLKSDSNGGVGLSIENASISARKWQLNLNAVMEFKIYDTAAGSTRLLIGTDGLVTCYNAVNLATGSGNVLIGTTTNNGVDKLQVNGSGFFTGNITSTGNTIRVATSRTPAASSAAGNNGEVCWDSSYIYVAVANNTWKRAALTTW